MPIISSFYGVVIRMYSEPNSPHKLPHLHAEYQGTEAVYDFNGNLIEGELPTSKARLVVAWITIHQKLLEKNWELLQNGKNFEKIRPLR